MVALLDKQRMDLQAMTEDNERKEEEVPICCCWAPDRTKTESEAEWYLRAEVVKLTSHGILFNSLQEEEIEDEVEIYWPENHSLETALHMQAGGRDPPTFVFRSFSSGDFFKLRARFFQHIAEQDIYRPQLNPELWAHIQAPLGCLPNVDSLLLAERMFLVSIVPNTEQMSHVLTEQFNIGG